MNVLSNYARVLDNSGPATIQRVNALRLSVIPIASHGPFTKILFCSCVGQLTCQMIRWVSFESQSSLLGSAWNSLCTPG